tara:strand:- start:2191 stop:6516 length:4326 start_codon:yes stop_codon:yes gene_type:complete
MSGGRGISFFGDNDTFNSNINTPEAEAKRDANRYKYGTDGKLLNPNKVKQSGKNISYKVGRKKEYTNSKQFEKDQQDNLNLLGDLFTDIKDYVNDGNQEATFLFAQMVKDSGYNQNHIIRMLAPLLGLPVDNNGKLVYNEKIAEEHVLNQNNVGAMLLATAIDDGNINDVMDIVKASYMQFALLESDDVKVNNAGYKSKMPDIFWDKIVPRIIDGKMKRTKGLGSLVRYTASGVDLNNYYLPGMKKTVTEHFGLGRIKNASEFIINTQNKLIDKILTGEISKKDAAIEMKEAVKLDGITKITETQKKKINSTRKANKQSKKYSKTGKAKGMSTFDFDETLIIDGENFVIATDPETKQEIRISSAEWPTKGPELAAMGYEMNFDDFVNVRGGKEGPLLVKMKNQIEKYGVENVFILTARPQNSDIAIYEWLKSNDVNIPFKNITGLGDSRGEAKAQWMLDKFAEGYNDMYFVDDALPNVDAVKEVLDQLDIKSKVVQAKTKVKVGPWLVDITTQEGRDFIKDYNNIVTVRSSDPDLANRKIKFSKSANKIADTFNQIVQKRKKDIKILKDDLKSRGYTINPTSRSSEFKRMGRWIIDTRTEEGKKFIRDYENIPTVSSSEFGPGHYEVNGKIYRGKYPNGKLVSKNGKIKFSKSKSTEFNEILENVKNIESSKVYSDAEARKVGALRGGNPLKNFFVPPSAEDFKGLLYRFTGRGKEGNKHAAFFKEHLLDPFAKGIRNWNTYKQAMSNDYKALQKKFPAVKSLLNLKVTGTSYTNEDAVRVYLWDKAGFEIPGLDEDSKNKLIKRVEDNAKLKMFSEGLSNVSKAEDGYVQPSDYWSIEGISNDLSNTVSKVGRKEFLSEWIENKNEILSPENLNKIEAIYGTSFRDELEKMLYRMETGQNRVTGKDAQVNKWLDWINGSVGAVMFLNMRSASLQTISMVNFINASDNNIFKASAAFANQPQFWKDFSMIFNSDMLKQRRAGLQIDVSASELTKAFNDGRGKPQAIISWMLEKGFKPTQIADSFAIAMGGAPFYRNRLKTYLKQGMSEAKAKDKAFLDFQEVAEETQQSSRPDLISNQQAGPMGRLILAWQNTPMQMTRLMKKKISDLINRRKIPGMSQVQSDMANISGIMYYGVAQNILFGTLQTGLMFMLFGWDEDEEKKRKLELRVANGALDTLLRGTGIYGAAVSTLKNVLMKWKEEEEKPGWKQDNWNIAQEAINLSPPIGSKMRKIMGAVKTRDYNKGVSEKIGLRLENPNISIAANWIEALTNAPVARIINKANNLEEAITGNHELWQRVALTGGWSKWSIGVKDEELEAAKEEVKQDREEQKKIEREDKKEQKRKDKEEEKKKLGKPVRCSGTKSDGSRCKLTTSSSVREQIAFKGSGKKTWTCPHHSSFKDGQDRDQDGKKEYRCTGTTSSGKRCNNRGEYTGKVKRCYAHK